MTGEPTLDSLIGIVGPCGAGKSTLQSGLRERGYRCTHIAQEHSYVPAMWRKIAKPDRLIFLEASFETCTQRRRLNWLEADYLEQLERLRDARQNADLVVRTDDLTPDQVLHRVLRSLGASP